ncbi:putative quinol monooxygenase [soil metagenome]
MYKYGLHGKLKATSGNGDVLASILLKASNLVASAKGCHLYLVSKDKSNPDSIWVTEVWDSKEDHDNSLKVEGVRELIAQAMPILDGSPEKGMELEVFGGAGLK